MEEQMREELIQKKPVKQTKKRKLKKRIGLGFLAVFLICVAGIIWYLCDYYHAQETSKALVSGNDTVMVKEIEQGLYLDGPGQENAIIFYPGAKVEYVAYLPIFFDLAEQGVDVFMVKMPVNLAMFGMNKADGIRDNYEYEHWYMAGHSLGGAMSARYVSKHLREYDGLILLAAYSTKSLKRDGFRVLSLYGSEDKVLRMDSFEKGRDYVPDEYVEVCIEGGNHAGFGDYGAQTGDGEAMISKEEQWRISCEKILQFMGND